MSASYWKAALCVVCFSLAGVALGEEAPASQPNTTAKLGEQITPGRGLTADEAARRARTTSPEIRAGQADVAASEAVVDEAKASWYPRLQGIARYTRLSDIGASNLGNLVATPPTVGPGPIPSGTQLINVPLTFPVLLNNYVLQASLTVPLSDACST
jgi:outer membrane protein TolC